MSEAQAGRLGLPPPRTLAGMLRYWGPGLVLTASVVGSGEVIGVPALGADAGYGLLWLIIASCVVKLPLQILIGRVAIQSGHTTLRIMNDLPGPRFHASWFVWAFVAMLVMVNLQQGAMVGGCGQILHLVAPALDARLWSALIVTVTVVLLLWGGYTLLERLATVMVLSFTLATVVCAGFLQGTAFRVHPGALLSGLVPHLSAEHVGLALGVFAITGIGTSEIVQYPYWCLDKGYGRAAGRFDGSDGWYARARGWIRVMHADAALSMVVYTIITVAFYVLGASVLHRTGQRPEGLSMIATLSRMYTETLGVWAYLLFLTGAFFALYSTLIVSVAANTVLFLDALTLMGVRRLEDEVTKERWRRAFVVALPTLQLGLYLSLEMPVLMVKAGALAQTLMLPVVAFAILHVRRRRLDPRLSPSRLVDALLVGACLLIATVALYGIIAKLNGGP